MFSTPQVPETSSPIQPSLSEMASRNQNMPFPVKFKGVVPQQNGNFGAQIYANHQRIWLGTFKSDVEAALAYDSACIKLRTGDNYRNFQLTSVTVHEPKFQSLHSEDAILNMIKDGSYQSKFAEFLRSREGEHELRMNLTRVHGFGGFSCKLLFQKNLTPSDVGKLNRLVVPKKDAVKYFPQISENPEENANDNKVGEEHLSFYDRTMKRWEFRYCYWKSSQSFVFTRGWNRFVKEKGLKANDTIAFFHCECQDKSRDGNSFYVIDVGHDTEVSGVAEVSEDEVIAKVDGNLDLCLRLGQSSSCESGQQVKERLDEHKFCSELELAGDRKKRVKLFGADIN